MGGAALPQGGLNGRSRLTPQASRLLVTPQGCFYPTQLLCMRFLCKARPWGLPKAMSQSVQA